MTPQETAVNGKTTTTRPLPTADEVRALLDYDPASGLLRWRKAVANWVRVGEVAGHLTPAGYTRINIYGRHHMAHRIAWLLTKGTWPAGDIDHRDGQRSNNALANLREATRSQNLQNLAKRRCPSSSRFLGVSYRKATGLWRARITLAGEERHLGVFPTQEEAYAAYLRAKAVLHLAQPAPRKTAYSLTASEKGTTK